MKENMSIGERRQYNCADVRETWRIRKKENHMWQYRQASGETIGKNGNWRDMAFQSPRDSTKDTEKWKAILKELQKMEERN